MMSDCMLMLVRGGPLRVMLSAVTPLTFAPPPQAKRLRINTTMVTLPGLKAWTWYCVRVQSRDDFYSKTSDFTVPHCMQTEGNAVTLTKLGALLPAAVTAQPLSLALSLALPLSPSLSQRPASF